MQTVTEKREQDRSGRRQRPAHRLTAPAARTPAHGACPLSPEPVRRLASEVTLPATLRAGERGSRTLPPHRRHSDRHRIVIVSSCHRVIASSHHRIIVSSHHRVHRVIVSSRHRIIVIASSHHRIIASSRHRVIASSHHRIIASSHHRIIASSRHRVIASSRHCVIASSHHRVIASSHHRIIASSRHRIIASTRQRVPSRLRSPSSSTAPRLGLTCTASADRRAVATDSTLPAM
jgi:hypothetical protein